MKRNTEAKRRAGFGEFVELPSCLYVTGTLLGILDYYQDVIYYVLPAGAANLGQNYVRCKRWRPAEQLYIPGPLQPWNDHERMGTFIPQEQVEKVVHFSRGMFNRSRYDALLTRQEGRTRDQDRARLFGAYIGRFERLASKWRYWNLTLKRFHELITSAELADSLVHLLNDNDFDMMVEAHEAILTNDSEPLEIQITQT